MAGTPPGSTTPRTGTRYLTGTATQLSVSGDRRGTPVEDYSGSTATVSPEMGSAIVAALETGGVSATIAEVSGIAEASGAVVALATVVVWVVAIAVAPDRTASVTAALGIRVRGRGAH